MQSSRFALLNPEVNLDELDVKKKEDKSKNDTKKNQKTNNVKKKKNNNEDLQNLAFGSGKPKSKKKSKNQLKGNNKENSAANAVQVDDGWKERDDQFIKTENEKYLREAIAASKLEFEEKKTLSPTKADDPEEQKKSSKTKKKKDKPIVLSLDQFNSMKPNQIAELGENPPYEEHPPFTDSPPEVDTFFDDVDETTRKTIERENKHKTYQATAGQFNAEIKATEYVAEIEKRDYEIQALRLEVTALKDELKNVKTRNKKLCEVISLSEMKSKGELVIELQKANKAHDEFSQEVTRLSAELEQEKTKVSQLQSDHRKSQGKKKHNADSTS